MNQFFIIDTNVLVSGLLTSTADSPVAFVLDGMLGARFPFALSEELLAEYRTVLARPRLCTLHGLSDSEIDTILVDIARGAIVLAPAATAQAPVAPDPGDQFLWNLLAARDDLVLVTGDKLLLHDPAMRHRVMSPSSLAALLR